jgi:iron complex outermembrane recepter protein
MRIAPRRSWWCSWMRLSHRRSFNVNPFLCRPTGPLAAFAICIAAAASPAIAQLPAQTRPFELPAAEMGQTLRTFAQQSGLQLLWSDGEVAGLKSAPLTGEFLPIEALRRVLADSGLEVIADPSGAYTVRRRLVPTSEAPAAGERVTITGTRLREEFAGAAPLQVIDAEVARRSGQLDTGTILRNSPQVTGPRSQLRYNVESYGGQGTFEGPGAQTIALRGLPPEQTLVLLNGRRLVASGTEGIPRSPDIGLIPQIIVSRYDILTDGASPTYGSDAVAGIVNVKLIEDFDGLTGYVSHIQPKAGNRETLAALSFGKTIDQGYFNLAGEYRDSKALKVRDARQFGEPCSTYYTRGPKGEIRTKDLISALPPGTSLSPCLTSSINRQTGYFVNEGGAEYYATPGRTNAGLPGFSANVLPNNLRIDLPGLRPVPFDADGNGRIDDQDSVFLDFNGSGTIGFDRKAAAYDTTRGPAADDADFIAPVQQLNLFAYGKRDLKILGKPSAFFEASFNRRSSKSRSIGLNTNPYIFSNGIVPATNPTNPCGLAGPGCIGVVEEVAADGTTSAVIRNGLKGAAGAFLQLLGDNDEVSSSVNQGRLLLGLEGDLGALTGIGSAASALKGWRYEVSGLYAKSAGKSSRRGILRDRMELSLQSTVRDPKTGQLVCGNDTDGDGIPNPTSPAPGAARTLSDCVPVNLFAENAIVGRRLTPIEESYVMGSLDYRTDVELAVVNAYLRGEAGRLPAGTISAVVGAEFRADRIDVTSTPSDARGSFVTYYAPIPSGAQGTRRTTEVFGELGVPLLSELPAVHRLDVSAGGRVTQDQFAGTNTVYALRGRWDLTDWFALRSTKGTSFRSPNLAELFQNPNSTTFGLPDPCVVPFEATGPDGRYIPSGDYRLPVTLERCRAQGLDPTTFGAGLNAGPSTTVRQGGAGNGLKPETSTSLTAGFVMSPPLAKWVGGALERTRLNLSATYYDIEVKDRIVIGDAYSVLQECYLRESGDRYCSRISRGADGFIESLNADYINRDLLRVRGIDFNALLSQRFNIGPRAVSASLEIAGNYERENALSDYTDTNFVRRFERSGTPAYPKLKVLSTAQVSVEDFVFTWFSNFVGSSDFIETPPREQLVTCLPDERNRCEFITKIPHAITHNLSLTWRPPGMAISFGINNVFDTPPPRIGALGPDASITNTPLVGNYPLSGRGFVFQVQKSL